MPGAVLFGLEPKSKALDGSVQPLGPATFRLGTKTPETGQKTSHSGRSMCTGIGREISNGIGRPERLTVIFTRFCEGPIHARPEYPRLRSA